MLNKNTLGVKGCKANKKQPYVPMVQLDLNSKNVHA